MKVITPSQPGVKSDEIDQGNCFIHRDVVHMRVGGVVPPASSEICAVILCTGQMTMIQKTTKVVPVNMAAVESQA